MENARADLDSSALRREEVEDVPPAADPEAAEVETYDSGLSKKEKVDGNIEIIDWDGPNDPDNRKPLPTLATATLLTGTTTFNWSRTYKWTLTLTTCFISILTGLPAGAYSAANNAMSREFHVSQSGFPYLAFATASWNMGAALFPLVFVPLSENTGRMPGYFASYILFLIWLIPCATAPNFAALIESRFFRRRCQLSLH